MSYIFTPLSEVITIPEIITIHYFEYFSDFSFDGESHDFWEFLCVDKGEIIVLADQTEHTLRSGEIIFHKPNEFHSLRANGKIAPNLVVIAFQCRSPQMDFFRDKTFTVNVQERSMLGEIISEARKAFLGRMDDPYQEQLLPNPDAPIGSEQLIRNTLERFLLSLIRRYTQPLPQKHTPVPSGKRKNNDEIYHQILRYLTDHLYGHLTIRQICHDNLIGRSQLQKLFQEKQGCGVIDYFSRQKINLAKQLIRDNQYNFTQISDMLGYNSIHYFSRQFKKLTGTTPSEYSSSIKAISEKEPES